MHRLKEKDGIRINHQPIDGETDDDDENEEKSHRIDCEYGPRQTPKDAFVPDGGVGAQWVGSV